MLRAEPLETQDLLSNRITEAIVRFRILIFSFIALLFILGFNGRWRLGLDSANYRGLALSIASGHGYVFGDWATHQAYPGLPYALGAVEYLLGPADRTPSDAEQQRLLGPSAATSASVLLVVLSGLLTLVIVYRLIRLHYAEWIAVTITCGVGTNAVFLQYSNELMTDVPFLLGVVLSLYGWDLLVRASNARQRAGATALIVPGVIIAGTMRPMFWVLLVCWAAVCAWGFIRGPRRFYGICLVLLLIGGGALLALSPRGYEREAMDWLPHAISRLGKQIHYTLHDQLPAAVFGEQLAPASTLGSLLLLGSMLLLMRRHLLWVLIVGCTFVVTVFLSAEPRYYLMVMPTLMLGWLALFCEAARRLPRFWGEVILVIGLSLVSLNNLSRSIRFFNEQHHSYTSKTYKNGEYAGVLQMCQLIRQHVPMDQQVLGPSGSIMSVLTGRHVVTQREIAPRGATPDTPRALLGKGIRFVVGPGRIYRSKEPVIYDLFKRHFVRAAGKPIAATATMKLARIKVVVPRAGADWRKLKRPPKRPTTRSAAAIARARIVRQRRAATMNAAAPATRPAVRRRPTTRTATTRPRPPRPSPSTAARTSG